MNRKLVRNVIDRKITQWIDSIEDQEARHLARRDVIVTGGCICSLLLGEKPKDFDIYFRTQEAVFAVSKYYVSEWKKSTGEDIEIVVDGDRVKLLIQSKGVTGDLPTDVEHFEDAYDVSEDAKEEKKKFRPVFFSSNAITLSDQIQIVIRFWGEVDDIHKNYDFVHCTNSWTSKENELVLRPEALEAILAKELVYSGSLYPICSMIRTRKFIKRGWSINAGQYLKMAFQISELDLKKIDVLEDQLTGVDSAYFGKLIDALSGHEDKISSSYVAKIVDRIF